MIEKISNISFLLVHHGLFNMIPFSTNQQNLNQNDRNLQKVLAESSITISSMKGKVTWPRRQKEAGNKFSSLENRRINRSPRSYSPPDIHTAFRADFDMHRELLDPRVVGAAKLMGVTVMEAKETAATLNISLLAMLGLEEAPVGEIVERYVMGGL
jgi:hypothetical protein